eukprot:gene5120-3675_t
MVLNVTVHIINDVNYMVHLICWAFRITFFIFSIGSLCICYSSPSSFAFWM